MLRLILVVLAITIALALAILAVRLFAGPIAKIGEDDSWAEGDTMEKIAFFLLLALMAYVASTGMS